MKIDHIVLLTRELEAYASAFERLGFQLTPLGDHGPAFGTGNRCIMFADHYVEILGIRAETAANAPLRSLLEHSAAVSMVALNSADIDATHRNLQERGLTVQGPIHFGREIEPAVAGCNRLEFAVIMMLPPHAGAEWPPFFCMQKTPEVMFAPQWRRHPNGATRLLGVDVEVHDPDATAAVYENIGAVITRDDERRVVIQDGPKVAMAAIGSLQPERDSAAAARSCMLSIEVENLDTARMALDVRKMPFAKLEDRLVVDVPGERRCLVYFRSR